MLVAGTTSDWSKGIGYALLIAGLLFILSSVYSMYNVYTGVRAAPSIINMNSVKFAIPAPPGTPPVETELISGAESSNGAIRLTPVPTTYCGLRRPQNHLGYRRQSLDQRLRPAEPGDRTTCRAIGMSFG